MGYLGGDLNSHKRSLLLPISTQDLLWRITQRSGRRIWSWCEIFDHHFKTCLKCIRAKIHEFLVNMGIYISPATISRILTKNNELFHQEKADIFKAGLKSTIYQQIDDTSAKVKGMNHYVQIICNPFYTAYFTIPHKDRLSILDVLQGGKPRTYFFNDEAFTLLKHFRLSTKMISKLRNSVLRRNWMKSRCISLWKRYILIPVRV